ncbi:MAG: NfeD family protein [Firmicutes bacterium]|nr:NfeD family protein [Bacillota bacterium]
MSPFVWILVGVFCGAVEVISITFVLMWIGAAAIATGIVSFFVPAFGWQVLVFALLSVGLLILSRPLVRRWRTSKTNYVSNVEALVGERGVVIERVTGTESGLVRVGSDVWSARSEPPDETFEAGEPVRVRRVKSTLLLVTGADDLDEVGP